jgi:hypothetical protein
VDTRTTPKSNSWTRLRSLPCKHGLEGPRLAFAFGHSFRIGSTTTYLRAGVNPKVVKKMARDAFLRYWRNTEDIFASHASNLSWFDFAI